MNDIRLESMIYGVAVGDALGVPYEFTSRKEMNSQTIDMIGYGTYGQPAGSWSDDTSLTLCLLDAIDYQSAEIDFEKARQNFVDWCFGAKFTAKNVRFDVGNTTFKAIRKMRQGVNIFNCGDKEDTHNGNGSLMRISPLIPILNGMKNMEDRFQLVGKVSSMTHGHSISIVGCHIYTEIMLNLWNGMQKFTATNKAKEELDDFYKDKNYVPFDISYKEAYQLYERIFQSGFAFFPENVISSEGYVLSTLEASIWCFLNSDDYEETVLKAVGLGNDTDTVAAIAGSMAGLYHGYDSIPIEWIDVLLNKELIDNLLEQT